MTRAATINQAIKLSNKNRKLLEPMMAARGMHPDGTIEEELLALHEAATKLGLAVVCKKGQAEINRRVASALIGVLIMADRLKVKDLEKEFKKRLKEIIEGNRKTAVETAKKIEVKVEKKLK